jgi:hypothetical protein
MYVDVYVEGETTRVSFKTRCRSLGFIKLNSGCELPSMALANFIEASGYDERACPRSQRHKRVPAVDEPLH